MEPYYANELVTLHHAGCAWGREHYPARICTPYDIDQGDPQ